MIMISLWLLWQRLQQKSFSHRTASDIVFGCYGNDYNNRNISHIEQIMILFVVAMATIKTIEIG